MNEDQQLIQFLTGLNEVFSAIRGNILMMKPLPTTAQAYSLILHEERQREVHSVHQVSFESTTFNVMTPKGSASSISSSLAGCNE